jgi:hypothetical protein
MEAGTFVSRYTNTLPDSGPDAAACVENGKLVCTRELQWRFSDKTNSNAVSPISRNCNGLEPNNPKF